MGRNPSGWIPIGLLLGACSSVPPVPEETARALPPVADLGIQERARAQTLADRALALLRLQRMSEAEDLADQALGLDPRQARARAARAGVLLSRARVVDPPDFHLLQRAEGELLLAARLAPEDPEVAVCQAHFLGAVGHLSAAAVAAERGVSADPDHPDALALAAAYRYELGEVRLARPHFESLLGVRPKDQVARYRLAACLVQLSGDSLRPAPERVRELRAAAALFATYREALPDDPDGAQGEAHALVEAARLDVEGREELLSRARDLLQDTNGLAPLRAALPYQLGVLEEIAGDVGAARAAYVVALDRDGDHPGALLNLAGLEIEAGAGHEAARHLEHLLELPASRTGLTPGERQRTREVLEGLRGKREAGRG